PHAVDLSLHDALPISGAAGSSVSIADANGCTRSGQRGSQSHSALPQRRQKLRSPGLTADSPVAASCSLARYTDTLSRPFTRRVAWRAPRLIAYPPPPAALRQIEQ